MLSGEVGSDCHGPAMGLWRDGMEQYDARAKASKDWRKGSPHVGLTPEVRFCDVAPLCLGDAGSSAPKFCQAPGYPPQVLSPMLCSCIPSIAASSPQLQHCSSANDSHLLVPMSTEASRPYQCGSAALCSLLSRGRQVRQKMNTAYRSSTCAPWTSPAPPPTLS